MDPYAGIVDEYEWEHEAFQEDVELYCNLLASGPVLEIGSGTGRITQALAAAGFEVWGVDPSAAMIGRARMRLEGLPQAHLVEASVLDLAIDRQFAAAIFPLNTLWHLTEYETQLRALQTVRRLLQERAVLLVDVSNPLTLADRGANGEVRRRFRRQASGTVLTGFSSAFDDEARQVLTLHVWYDRLASNGALQRSETVLDLRYLYRFELEGLLRLAGFETEHAYGSYDLEPYSGDSSNIIVMARAASQEGTLLRSP
ncbi:MAG TPA: class I SAM-dependent methyltransferase [Chloroflexota bacterium]|nr:class I SAM-dependent methyltransferase [Chloroflexota bacterium]